MDSDPTKSRDSVEPDLDEVERVESEPADSGEEAGPSGSLDSGAGEPDEPVTEEAAVEETSVTSEVAEEDDASTEVEEEVADQPVEAEEAVVEAEEAVEEADKPKRGPAPSRPEPAIPGVQLHTPGPSGKPMDWFVVRVQSGKEDRVRESLLARVKAMGWEEHFGRVLVPSESITEIKGGRKRVVQRKIYPGYIMVELELNDDAWFLIRETPGIGDFVGPHMQPVPMQDSEIAKLLGEIESHEEQPKLKIDFEKGDSVKIKEGPFENFDGVVEEVVPTKGIVKVIVTIFGRATEVELEYWQVEAL